MASDGQYSNLPSGISRGATNPSSFKQVGGEANGGGTSPLVWMAVALSLLLSITSFYLSFSAPHKLSAAQREEIRVIATSLRAIQEQDHTLTSPLKTTVYIDEAIPMSEVFPPSYSLPVSGQVRIDQTLNTQTTGGQIVPIKINTTIPVSAQIPINSKELAGSRITIKKEIPIDTRLSLTMRVQALYGKEFGTIIDKLEKMAEEG